MAYLRYLYYSTSITESTANADIHAPVTPETVRPFTKPKAKEQTKVRRKLKKSTIWTSTPEKEAAREKHLQKKLQANKSKKAAVNALKKQGARKLLIADDESTSEDEDIAMSIHDSSDENSEDLEKDMTTSFEPGDLFVVVKFPGCRSVAHYVGKILEISGTSGQDKEMKTSFLRRVDMRRSDNMAFSYPNKEDIAIHRKDDIAVKLPRPKCFGGTARCSEKLNFGIDLSYYDPL